MELNNLRTTVAGLQEELAQLQSTLRHLKEYAQHLAHLLDGDGICALTFADWLDENS